MNDVIAATRVDGEVLIDGENLCVRRRRGRPATQSRHGLSEIKSVSKSIFDNVAYGLRINRLTSNRRELADRVEEALTNAALCRK
jgi:phosphate transport system ATP-binding protein